MKAVIMAGGFGKRLHPLTVNLPKPLVPVCNKPIMHHVIDLLVKNGINEAIVLLYHQPKQITDYFGDGSKFGIRIKYLTPPKDFGTAGAVKYAEAYLNETFIVISADIICDFDLAGIVSFHKKKKALATIALARVDNPLQYGIVITSAGGAVKHFSEKPSWAEVFSDTINTGIYIFEPEVFKHIVKGREYDFSLDLFPFLLNEKQKLYGCVKDGYWKDIGSLLEYNQANRDLLEKKNQLSVSSSTKVSSSAKIDGLVVIGDNTFVSDDVYLSNSCIGSNVSVGRGSKIINSVIWDKAEIRKEVIINNSVVLKRAVIDDRANIEEGAVIGDGSRIGADTKIRADVKIWPDKIIEEGSVVNSSMISQKIWSKNIFGTYGVTGVCNVDITPEFAAKLGSAFGAMLGLGSYVTCSMDGHRSSRMIHRALISGILAAGVNISNLENVPIPINRFELKTMRSKGGFHVRRSPFDAQVIDIKFFDSSGMNLSSTKEKIIEKLFWSEDYEKAGINEVGEIVFPISRVSEGYRDGFLNYINAEKIRHRKFRIVIDYAYGSASTIFPQILGELGCETVAINGHMDENKLTKTKDEFDKSLKQLSKIVISLHADLGIMFDAGAEKIFLVDEKGRILKEEEALLLFSYLVINYDKAEQIAVPFASTSAIEDIADKKKVKVLRTKNNFRSMMEAAAAPKVSFLGEPLGGYIFPAFQASFDAMLSSAKLLELLSNVDAPVSLIAETIPKRFTNKTQINCPNRLKGAVIREIFDENKNADSELLDGVKIHFKNDWVLINGHPDKQEIYIVSESSDNDRSRERIRIFVDIVKKIIAAHNT